MSYLERLDRELTTAGIGGRRHARILAEFADHLEADPKANLGEPAELAREFADQLGTVLARRAAFTAFAGLAVAAILFGVGFVTARNGFYASAGNAPSALAHVGAWCSALGAQVAFVAGTLAALRAFRRRGSGVVSREEAEILVRRAGVGLAAGILTMVGFGLSAIAERGHVASWWTTLSMSLAGAGIVVLLATGPMVLAAARLRPVAAGAAGDLNEDFGPLVPRGLRGSPWRVALVLAAAIVVVLTLAGIVQADPFDGAARGLADGLACLAGFALLGRYLGLRA